MSIPLFGGKGTAKAIGVEKNIPIPLNDMRKYARIEEKRSRTGKK